MIIKTLTEIRDKTTNAMQDQIEFKGNISICTFILLIAKLIGE